MAGLGAWIAVQVTQPVHPATVIAAASGQAVTGGLGGSLPSGNSAISGSSPLGGGLPEIGAATRAVLASGPWRAVAVAGAVAVIAAGLLAAWRGPRWAVMSARFDRPSPQAGPGSLAAAGASAQAAPALAATAAVPAIAAAPATAAAPGPAAAEPPAAPVVSAADAAPAASPAPGGPAAAASARHPEGDAAALWEALDRGVDLTDTTTAGPADAEPVAAPVRGEEQ
jgi:hypothetical protein